MFYFLIIWSVVATTIASVAMYLCFKLLSMISRLEEHVDDVNASVEESLDVLDETFRTLSEITSIEVFTDEPVVRRLIDSIKKARSQIASIAAKIYEPVASDSIDATETNKKP